MPATATDYLHTVLLILNHNGIDISLSDHEAQWVVLCYIRRNRPDECAFGIADVRDSMMALRTQPWTRNLVEGGRWDTNKCTPEGGNA